MPGPIGAGDIVPGRGETGPVRVPAALEAILAGTGVKQVEARLEDGIQARLG